MITDSVNDNVTWVCWSKLTDSTDSDESEGDRGAHASPMVARSGFVYMSANLNCSCCCSLQRVGQEW